MGTRTVAIWQKLRVKGPNALFAASGRDIVVPFHELAMTGEWTLQAVHRRIPA